MWVGLGWIGWMDGWMDGRKKEVGSKEIKIYKDNYESSYES